MKINYFFYIVALLGLNANANANAISEYYCPHSNVLISQDTPSLEQKGLIVGSPEGIYDPFPNAQKNVESNNNGRVYFDVQGCSSEKIECLQLIQYQSLKEVVRFSIFFPKKIESDKEYEFKNMRLITSPSVLSSAHPSEPLKIQATLWQIINGKNVSMRFIVEQGRGVVYWDGLNFWWNKGSIGEMCILQGKKGFFSNVVVEQPSKKNQNPSLPLL